jgi:hypothetical protein
MFTKEPKNSIQWWIKTSHLLFIVSTMVLLLTGLRIAVANEPKYIWLSMALPQGNVHSWHFRFAFVLALAFLFYVVANYVRRSFPKLKHSKTSVFAFRLSHYAGLSLLTSSVISGSSLFFGFSPLPIEYLVNIHFFSALGLLVYLFIHGLLAFLALPWRNVFRIFQLGQPKSYTPYFLIAGIGLFLIGSVFLLGRSETLNVVFTNKPMEIDGEARESIWENAPKIVVQTYQGYQQPVSGTLVTLQAAHDNDYAYFLVSWADTTRSQSHLPLIKTNEGWKILQSDIVNNNENVWYEDKLAIMLSTSSELAGAGTVQLGHSPKLDQPSPANNRGLHFTTDGSITDVWHWKSVRTGLSLNQADDNFFGPPVPSTSEYKRYTAGYQKDTDDCEHLVRWDGSDYQTKPDCGGYLMNWTLPSDGIVVPLRLPKHADFKKRLGNINSEASMSDFGSWWLNWNDTIAYHPDSDTFDIGTIIPSVLSLGPFSQGRGDVSATGYWRDGRWQLELKRKLNTNSRYDLPIESDMNLWVSTFDHSQTRHSYHLRPIVLKLRGKN